MKLRKFISWIVTAAVVMTNAVIISMPVASAETVDTATVYSEDFEGFANTNYSPTLTALQEYNWFVADNNSLYTEVGSVAPYSTYSGKFAKITGKDDSQVLQISSAGEGNSEQSADIPKYGYAKVFPGLEPGQGATGVWEVSFDFKPMFVRGSDNKYGTQFAFTLNTTDGSEASETAAVHNIIAGYGGKFYLGYRNYNTLLNNNVQQGTILSSDYIKSLSSAWFTVKTILNCDAHYYTVELYDRDTGEFIARRSPISFDSNETIGCIKFSALGFKQASYLYIDNISMEKIEVVTDKTIYNETFDTFSNESYAAADGMTTGTSPEDFTGNSYFEGYTPWRFHEDIGNSYAFESDSLLGSQVVRLGDKLDTEETEASGLVYMQIDEPLLTQKTQDLRGILKTSFKIKPETIVDDVTLNISMGTSYDITDDNYAAFKIVNDEGTPKYAKANGDLVALDASTWYDAEITFDVGNRIVTTVIKDIDGNSVASNRVTGGSAPTAVKGMMFKVKGGSSVLMDDIKLEYYTIPPTIDVSKIVLTDSFGEKVTDTENVTTALKTIEVPMGCPIDNESVNTSVVKLFDSSENAVAYTGSATGNTYTMTLSEALKINEEYTVVFPASLTGSAGGQLGEEVRCKFKTLNRTMDISAVSVNGAPVASVYDIEAGSTVNVTVSFANGTDTDIDSAVTLSFYGDDELINMQSVPFTVSAGASGIDEKTVAFTIPEDIDMDAVDSLSIFAWNGFKYLSPLSRSISLKKKAGEAGKFRSYVDFEVNVPTGREPVILQLSDPQIIDSSQRREGKLNNTAAINFWLPSLMNTRLFNDLKALVNKVNPDLILMTGDLVYGGYDDAGTSFTRLADTMDSFGIPWAPVFGNHDNESQMGVDWQCNYLESCDNCLFKQRTLTGNGNYSIGIVQGDELKRVIFMLDSNGCAVMSDESFANGHSKKEKGFGEDQVEWYTGVAEKINEKFANMKYTFAFHIQPAAFEDAFAAYGFVNDGEKVPDGELNHGDFVNPINIDELENKKDTDFGYIGRGLKTPWDADKTVFNGMKALGADSILVGHEHCNSASVVYEGVRFQYGQKIGEYDRINFKTTEGKLAGASAYLDLGTPVLGGTVMKLSEETGAISNAYIEYCAK